MFSRRSLLLAGAAGVLSVAAGASVAAAFGAAMAEANARVSVGSAIVPTRFGALEYARAGEGAPFLMIHGSGGGFDQGLAFARRFVDGGYDVIAPSRFGYLRSDFPADPGSANQADAFADLLDALGVDEAAVCGGSAGALSAIEFAIRHPARCTALIALVPATHAPARPSHAPMSRVQERAMRAMLGSDFLFWASMNLARKEMYATMLATDPALIAASAPWEQTRAARILRDILPVSRRARGLMNDARLTLDPAPQALEEITAPTLAWSLEDDRFGTLDAARHIAATVPGARLVAYPSGGHIWIGRDEELFTDVDAFLRGTA